MQFFAVDVHCDSIIDFDFDMRVDICDEPGAAVSIKVNIFFIT